MNPEPTLYPPIIMSIVWLLIMPLVARIAGWGSAIDLVAGLMLGAWGYWASIKMQNK
jgi:hypothetical protein